MRTGTHEEHFCKGTDWISVITYGILWKWLTGDHTARGQDFGENPLQRYSAIFLDEFAELPPKSAETCRLLGRLARGNTANGDRLRVDPRILVSVHAISPQCVDAPMGSHAFLTITGRHFTLDRSVVSPKQRNVDLLETAANLAVSALKRTGRCEGHVLIFCLGGKK